MISTEQDGGGFWDLFMGAGDSSKKSDKPGYFTKAVNTEAELLDSFENLADSAKRYYNAYNEHVQSLITLDDIHAMKGLLTTFKKTIVGDTFKNVDRIDRSNPLLLRNYLAGDETTPRNFRKEHLLSQIRYCIRRFHPKDEILIQDIDVALEDNKAVVSIRTINGDLHERKVLIDDNFNLDLDKMKADIREIIKSIKQKMDFEIEVVSDFELPKDGGLELPGAMFITPGGLDRKLSDMGGTDNIIRVGPENAIPISQARGSGKSAGKPMDKNFIFGYSTTKKKTESRRKPGNNNQTPPPEDIGLEQGFGGRKLEQASIKDELLKLLDGPAGMLSPDEIKDAIGGQQAPPLPAVVVTGQPAPPPAYTPAPPVQTRAFGSKSKSKKATAPGAAGNIDILEQKCKAISDPNSCKQTLGCYYNYTKKVCHRDVKI
jgi:hypothetical protein